MKIRILASLIISGFVYVQANLCLAQTRYLDSEIYIEFIDSDLYDSQNCFTTIPSASERLNAMAFTADYTHTVSNPSSNKQSSFFIKFAGDVILDKFKYRKPLFLEFAARYQYKTGFYEIGFGPGIIWCTGNEYFFNLAFGVLSLANNFHIAEKKKSSLYIFTLYETPFSYIDLEDGDAGLVGLDDIFPLSFASIGLGWKLGENKKTRLEIGIKRQYYGFFEDTEWTYGHVGLGFIL